jgi:hypothetical protein
MKKGTSVATFVFIGFLLLLSFLNLQPIGVRIAKANLASANWHTTAGWPEAWDEYWPDEVDVSHDVVYYVAQLYYSLDYNWVMFNYDPYVTASSIYGVADQMDDYTYATVFIYQHGCVWNATGWITDFYEIFIPVPVEHYYAFCGDMEDPDTLDYSLYFHTNNGHHYFVFLYTCASGKQIGYYDEDQYLGGGLYWMGTGPLGWPYAWTHQDHFVLSDDGYGDPDETDYCFIGFETFSPPMTNETGYNDKTMGDFVKAFYDQALDTEQSYMVKQALDYASYEAFGVYHFYETQLYGDGWNQWLPSPVNEIWHTSMRVFSNGENYIPTG